MLRSRATFRRSISFRVDRAAATSFAAVTISLAVILAMLPWVAPASAAEEACTSHLTLVVDTSASILGAGADNPETVKSSIKAILQGLAETDTVVSIISFRRYAQVEVRRVGVRNNAETLVAAVDGLDFDTSASDGDAGTNWEAGLGAAGEVAPDRVVLFTDGLPNRYGSGLDRQIRGNDASTTFDPAALQAAKLQADFLRNQGVAVQAVGVGEDVRVASLVEVAGGRSNEDYFVGAFDNLAPALAEAALQGCADRLVVADSLDGQPAPFRGFEVQSGGLSVERSTGPGGSFSLPLAAEGDRIAIKPVDQTAFLATALCRSGGQTIAVEPNYRTGAISFSAPESRFVECFLDERSTLESALGRTAINRTTTPVGLIERFSDVLNRREREMDDVNLWVRGYIKHDCMYAYMCSGNERIAQVLALQYAAQRAEGREFTSKYVDWEVSDSKARRKGTQFSDIMVHRFDSQWQVSEVKKYTGPATTVDVELQLQGYVEMLDTTAGTQGNCCVSINKDPRFMVWYAKFQGKPDFFDSQDVYVVWSPEPGHIYFKKQDELKKSKDPVQKQIYEEANRYMKDHDIDTVNGWGASTPFIPSPLRPAPVPVPLVPV